MADLGDLCENQLRHRVRFAEAEITALREALEASVKLQSHYADLLNMHDSGQRMTFATADDWIARLKVLGADSQRQEGEDGR